MNFSTSRTRTIAAAAVVAIAAIALYWGTLHHGFVYDDLVIVENNPSMREPANALRLFSPDYFHISGERTFRPLNTLSYIVDAALWRGNAAGFHLTNVLLHAACAVLLFFLILRLTQSHAAALLGALLFAAHPLNTEAVCAVTFREDLLGLLFVIAGLLAYARWRDAAQPGSVRGQQCLRLAVLAALAFLGLAGKESAVVLLPAIIAYDWLIFPGVNLEDRALRMAPALGVVCAAFGAFFALYFYLGQYSGGGAATYPGGSAAAALPVMASAFMRYLYLFLAPFRLCADYSQNYVLGWSLQAVLGAALIVLLPAAAVAMRRVLPATAFGVFFFISGFAPVSNVLPFGAVFAERYAYMPNAGLCIAFVALLLERPRTAVSPVRSRGFYVLFIAALCAGFAYMTVNRTAVWRDGGALWRDTVACCHDCARPHVNLGRVLLENNKPAQARKILEVARKLDAQNFQVWIALGRAYADLGRTDQAIHAYESAIRLEPKVKYPYYNLALVYEDHGQYYLAEMNLIKAIKLDPNYLDARLALANVLFKKRLLSPPEIELLQYNLAHIRDALPASDSRRIEAEENSHILMQVLERGRETNPSVSQ